MTGMSSAAQLLEKWGLKAEGEPVDSIAG